MIQLLITVRGIVLINVLDNEVDNYMKDICTHDVVKIFPPFEVPIKSKLFERVYYFLSL